MKNLEHSMEVASSGLSPLSKFVASSNTRSEKADLTNANHLFGDPDDDMPYGDADYGDLSPLAIYSAMVGDLETGAPMNRKLRNGLMIGGGAAVLGGTAAVIAKATAKKKAAKALMRREQSKMTIDHAVEARRMMGKMSKTEKIKFFSVSGALLNSAPISTNEHFIADSLKLNLDLQASQTPFEVEIASGTYSAGKWSVKAVGTATPRFYSAVILVIGINQLSANPGTVFTVTGSMPTIGGALTISSNPLSFTIQNGYYVKLMIFPWQIVTNKPLLSIGQYSADNNISFDITGLPSAATVTLTVPGSQHSWTLAMRSALL